MKLIFFWIFIGLQLCVIAQKTDSLKCIYAVEGFAIDGLSYETLKYVIIRNEKFGLTTFTDDNGYYCLSIPVKYLDSAKSLEFQIYKESYSPQKFWIGYNPFDSIPNSISKNCLIWNYDLKMIRLSKINVNKTFYVTAHARIGSQGHGYSETRETLQYFIRTTKRNDRLEVEKLNNEKVIFKLDSNIIICTKKSTVFLDNKEIRVFVNNKRIPLDQVNKYIKRSNAIENPQKKEEYYESHKKYKGYVIFIEDRLAVENLRVIESDQ